MARDVLQTPVVAQVVVPKTTTLLSDVATKGSSYNARHFQSNDPNAWPYPVHMDGWVCAHNALRHEMSSIQSAAERFAKQVSVGEPLNARQVSNFKRFWQHFSQHVYCHDSAEEKVLFPFVRTKAVMPYYLWNDHQVLHQQLHACSATATELRCTGNCDADSLLLKAFLSEFSGFRRDMEFHLRMEERLLLPIIRKGSSHKQMKPVIADMRGRMSTQQQAAMLSAMDDASRQSYLKHAGVSSLVYALVLAPAVKKYQRSLAQLLGSV